MCFFTRASAETERIFGGRVQKIPVNAGFGCPNRDGTLSDKGCLYCCNSTFAPFYASDEKTITRQLAEGREYFGKRYGCTRFFAYFQSYTNTYASVDVLEEKYREAMQADGVEGLIISTRPDCLGNDVLSLLERLQKETYIRIELGAESFDDDVLTGINRCHTAQAAITGIKELAGRKLPVSVHLIFGLPGEKDGYERRNAEILNECGADMTKLHHLQIVKGSELAASYAKDPSAVHLLTLDEYLDLLCGFLSVLSPKIAIERFINRVPLNMLIAPKFGISNEEQFQTLLTGRLLKT